MVMIQGMIEIEVSYEVRTRVKEKKYITIEEYAKLNDNYDQSNIFFDLEDRFTEEIPDYIAESICIEKRTY